MSTNCIQCVKNKRRGPDLLCDACREKQMQASGSEANYSMEEPEFLRYVKLLSSMCLDYQMDGISRETFISNLDIISRQIGEQYDHKTCSQGDEE